MTTSELSQLVLKNIWNQLVFCIDFLQSSTIIDSGSNTQMINISEGNPLTSLSEVNWSLEFADCRLMKQSSVEIEVELFRRNVNYYVQ